MCDFSSLQYGTNWTRSFFQDAVDLIKSKEPVNLSFLKSSEDLKSFQKANAFCKQIAKKVLRPDKVEKDFVMEDGTLYQEPKLSVRDFSQCLQVVLP